MGTGLWRRPPRDTVRCALLARPEIPRGCGAVSAWPSYRRSPSSRRAQLPWVGSGTIPDLRGCPLSQAWPPSACAQSGRWVRASGRAPRGCGEPWASGSATHAGLDPLAGHARGIDRGLGYHGGGARSAPRVRDLDHASYHADGSAIERVLVQDSHRSPTRTIKKILLVELVLHPCAQSITATKNLIAHMSNAHSITALKVIDDKLPETWTDIKSMEAILWLNKSIGIENHYIASGHQTYIPSRSKNPLKLLAESPVRR